MRLSVLRRHWERFGRRDPYWAVLTDPDKQDGGWDVAEFFQSGTDEIDAALERASGLGIRLARRRALDFGCGAGRLTQAMAAQFERCDGVDISESMLDIARRHNRYGERCAYHLNDSSDLALFGDHSFDFVYSTLVLQHMEPRYSKLYMRELLRVLAPGDCSSSRFPASAPPRRLRPTRNGRESVALCARTPFMRISTIEPQSLSADSGKQISLDVTVENRSRHAWPSLPTLGVTTRSPSRTTGGTRTAKCCSGTTAGARFRSTCEPGSRASVMLVVTTPPADGFYVLELDLVRRMSRGLASEALRVLRVPVAVGNAAAAPRRRAEGARAAATAISGAPPAGVCR